MDLSYEQAVERILAQVPRHTDETLELFEAEGRILTETIQAALDLPPFDNSSMDGYAVRAQDVATASPSSPVRLQVIGKVAAGGNYAGSVGRGQCVRVFTGSPLPSGVDAIVMQEDTQEDSAAPGTVFVMDAVAKGEHVRRRGEDVAIGTELATSGERLSNGLVALLAAAGRGAVLVGARPRVGIIATGSELRESDGVPAASGKPLPPGAIYESNRAGLAGFVRAVGGVPVRLPLVVDELGATSAALSRAFERSEIVVTCGGVSVGEFDLVRRAFLEVGGQLEFWRVAMKPGRPFGFGKVGGKLFFGLPGNPVSALVTFFLLVRPALLRWQGAADVQLRTVPGILAEPLSNPGDRRHFLRVRVSSDGKVVSAGKQGSHILTSFARANGLVDMTPGATLSAGAPVQVLRWD